MQNRSCQSPVHCSFLEQWPGIIVTKINPHLTWGMSVKDLFWDQDSKYTFRARLAICRAHFPNGACVVFIRRPTDHMPDSLLWFVYYGEIWLLDPFGNAVTSVKRHLWIIYCKVMERLNLYPNFT